MKLLFTFFILLLAPVTWAFETYTVDFPTNDRGTIFALYSPATSNQGIVLGHGAVFDKHSWGFLTQALHNQKISVLALDFRGYGQSKAGEDISARDQDILAGVSYLKAQGVKQVSVLGASMGGGAAAVAASRQEPGQIDKLILLSPVAIAHPEQIKSQVLYIASQDEAMAQQIKAQFEKVTTFKQIQMIPGKAHAQHIFKTEQKEKLNQVIIDFLNQKDQ